MARLSRDTFKPLMLAILLLGVGLLAFGLYRFVSNSQALDASLAQTAALEASLQQQIAASGGTPAPGDPAVDAAGRMLFSASMGQRQLAEDRMQGVIILGAGVVLTALGWLGYDLLRGKKQVETPAS